MKKISGRVIRGKRKGRELGFPTANLELKENIASGVYAGKTNVMGKKYEAAIFAFNNLLEVHILNFDQDIYGKEIEVEFGEKMREAMKFGSDADLKKQIAKDIEIISNLKF